MDLISVNQVKCTKCGICIEVCPTRIMSMDEKGPILETPDLCIACGHCVAACPNEAIDNSKNPLSKQIELKETPVINADVAEQFLRSRRSIRCFKNKNVPLNQLLKLLDIARFAPTASNSQGLSFIIVNDRAVLEKATEITVQWMEGQLENPLHKSFPLHVRAVREKGINTILRDAPHLILATAPIDFKNGRENTIFSFAYLELFANILGLGSCWAGLLEMCAFSNHKPLIELFNIPDGKVLTGAVMVGFPKYNFKRLVERNSLEVLWLDCDEMENK
ncbi:MAG: ferredoxin [Firmicutes bacterium]|nr:ferredoxin [Bacillota bacterium]